MKIYIALLTIFSASSYCSPVVLGDNPFLDNHVRWDQKAQKCEIVAKVQQKNVFPSKSLKECQKRLPQLINADYKYYEAAKKCVIISYPFKVTEIDASDEDSCRINAKTFFQRKGVHPPFLDYETWHDKTSAQFNAVATKVEKAMENCRIENFGDLDVFYRYDKRVKELKSTKDKVFTRVVRSQKYDFDFVWNYNMNDGIGFRIVFNTVIAPGGVKAFMDCLKAKLDTTPPRTIDEMTYYASSTYDVPSMNVFKGQTQGKAILEYQTWSLASGLWMIWQHDLYYKFPKDQVSEERKAYVKSNQMAALCMDDPTFVREILPSFQSKEELVDWLHENCNDYLEKKHEVAEKKKLARNPEYEPKKYEPKSEKFNLRDAPDDVEPIDLPGIVWEEFRK